MVLLAGYNPEIPGHMKPAHLFSTQRNDVVYIVSYAGGARCCHTVRVDFLDSFSVQPDWGRSGQPRSISGAIGQGLTMVHKAQSRWLIVVQSVRPTAPPPSAPGFSSQLARPRVFVC